MRALAFLLLASALLAPLAQAQATPSCFTTLVFACVNETSSGDACASEGATGTSSTTLFVLTPAGIVSAGGRSTCAPGFRDQGAAATFSSGATFAHADWSDGGDRGCFMTVAAGAAGQFPRQFVTCPAGAPPNPGWGSVLP